MNTIERERATRAKAVKLLEKDGWKCWYPVRPGGKFRFPNSRTDIFGLFDIIAVPADMDVELSVSLPGMEKSVASVRFIQLKTNHHGEIDEKYRFNVFIGMPFVTAEYWSYETKKRKWRRVILLPSKTKFSDYGL